MRIVKTYQVLLYLLDHLVSAHTPLEAVALHNYVPGIRSKQIDIWLAESPATDGTHLKADHVELVARSSDAPQSCDRRAKCKRKKIRDPTDASKCKRCLPLLKADPTQTICIKDNDVNQDEKKRTCKDKIKEKAQQKMKEFKDKIKERIEQKKPAKTTEWEKKDATRRDQSNNKKSRRMAQCLPLVAAAIGTQAMLEMADGGFSEDLLDGIDNDMLALWPGNDIDDTFLEQTIPDDLGDIAGEGYVNLYLQVGDAATANRSIERRDMDHEGQAGSISPEQHADKRNIFSEIIKAFAAIGRAIASVASKTATKIGQEAARATKFFSTRQPNLKKPGESKWTRPQQVDKAKEVSKNKNWTKCLRGEKPEK